MRRIQDLHQAYLQYTNEMEAPERFHTAVFYWVVSSVLRKRVRLNQSHFIYTPNQYFVLVAPPGIIAKSTTAGVGVNLLKEIPEVIMGPSSVTWQALFEALGLAQREEIYGDPKDLLAERQITASLSIAASELGTFLDMKETGLVNFLIEFWDGQDGQTTRQTRKDGAQVLINPLINFIGCTTESWLKGNFNAQLLDGGLGSRLLFVHATEKRKYVAYPNPDDEKQERLKRDIIHDLKEIGKIHGEMRLSADAKEWGTELYLKHHTTPVKKSYFDGYHTRKFVHIHKLAIVIALAESDELIVQRRHLIKALNFLEGIEDGIVATTEVVNSASNLQGEKISRVKAYLRAVKETTMSLIYKNLTSKMNTKEIDQAINDLFKSGELEKVQEKTKVTIVWKGT